MNKMKNALSLGPLMLDIEGVELSSVDSDILRHPLVGGVILFARNYESREQVTALCNEIHSLRSEPLLIAVDHEGGRVQRFRDDFTRIPCMRVLGGAYTNDKQVGLEKAENVAWLMAAELRQVGVDFSFAPVLDLDYGCSEIIGDRAFSNDKVAVAEVAEAFQRGLTKAGMTSIGKHFPGHGAVAPDSHIAIPVDERPLDTIIEEDVYPFKQLIRAGMKGIMPAHVIYQQVDSLPAGFSSYWLQDVLRQQLSFQGAIFSDDLSMHGASVIGDFEQRARQTLTAGADMALVCNNRSAAEQVIDRLNGIEINAQSTKRLEAMRPSSWAIAERLEDAEQWKKSRDVIEALS